MIGISTLHFSIRLLLAIAMGATVGLEPAMAAAHGWHTH
jgi:uncharacterized membrane protein YhiD involved in acid resistance